MHQHVDALLPINPLSSPLSLPFFYTGRTMYKYLPRHTFGYIQSKLFPKYFMLGTVLSSIVLGTFIIDNPINNWNFEQKLQVKAGYIIHNINCIVVPITGPANHTHIQCSLVPSLSLGPPPLIYFTRDL